MKDQIPYGFCHCGCGEKTEMANRTDPRYEWVSGEPRRFVLGHKGRVTRKDITIHPDGYGIVPLSNGEVATIDAEDIDKVICKHWGMRRPGARSKYAYSGINGDGKREYMHRLIMSPPEGMVVDHISGDGLDNRKANLRICTRLDNQRNRSDLQSNNTSGYVGVNSHAGKWAASIHISGKRIHLGRFLCPVEAAIFRDIAAIEEYGEFAHLNFPELNEVFA